MDDAVLRVLDDVGVVADGVVEQADTPTPTATAPRAASSLRTLRGYPREQPGAPAPVAARWPCGRRRWAWVRSGSAQPGPLADVVGNRERRCRGWRRSIAHVQDAAPGVEPEIVDQ